MPKVQYEVVEHDGGWAYRVDEVFSETFTSETDALAAAEIAASNHEIPGDDETIEYQDPSGQWHAQISPGFDRPQTEVVDAHRGKRTMPSRRDVGPLRTFIFATGVAWAAAYILRQFQRR